MITSARLSPAAAILLVTMLLNMPVRATAWVEIGDAGALPASSQVTMGTGLLNSISGTLSSDGDVDMYRIHIISQSFQGAMQPLVSFDQPDLWLFDLGGNGVLMNDTVSNGQCWIAGSPPIVFIQDYYLAVSSDGADAISAGGKIWNSPWVVGARAADGPGAAQPLINWGGTP